MKSYSNEKGFTILEILVVTALLALMSSILYGTIGGFIRGRNVVLDGRASQRTAISVMSRINEELLSRVARPLSSGNAPGPSNRYIEGTNDTLGDADNDKIRFISDGSGQQILGAGSNKGRVEISYYLEKPEDQSLDFGAEDRNYVLIRSEKPYDISDKQVVDKRTVTFPIAANVRSFNLRYFDKAGTWKQEWGPTQSGFPNAIEITLKVAGDSGNTEVYQTAVAIKQ